MRKPLRLEKSFTTWMNWYQIQIFNPDDYKKLFPLFVFDVSKQSERIKYSVTDIHIRASFTANPGANVEAYAVLLSDRLINFQSDGNKMAVIY